VDAHAGAVDTSNVTVMYQELPPALIPGMFMTATELPSGAMVGVPPCGVPAPVIFRPAGA
jgi:hypothetical protein